MRTYDDWDSINTAAAAVDAAAGLRASAVKMQIRDMLCMCIVYARMSY